MIPRRPKSPKLPRIRFSIFWIIFSVCYCLIFTSVEFINSPVSGIKGFITLSAQWFTVAACTSAVLGLLCLSRKIFCVAGPLLLCVSAALAYFRLTMGVTLTPMVIELATINDTKTCLSIFSPLLVVSLLGALAIGIFLAIYRYRFVLRPTRTPVWAIIFATVALAPAYLIPRLHAPVKARMPFSIYYSVRDYMHNRAAVAEERHTFDNAIVKGGDNAPDVILVIGESLRADHLSLNGYSRPTTPRLEADTAVVSLPDMWSIPRFTHQSVPHILTRADSLHPDRAYEEQSVITLFRHAGYHTSWLTSQDAVPHYAYFMHEADTLIMSHAAHSLYDFGAWYDSDLIEPFNTVLKMNESTPKFVVIHTIGSHWWYPAHYSPAQARFKPEVGSRILSDLTHEEIVNSYDNTIVATDDFLSEIISGLRDRNALLIYISDHGESLGEDGHYLHADDMPAVHRPACLVWYSHDYARLHPDRVAALRSNASRAWCTDAIFHTLLDGAALETPFMEKGQSFFRGKMRGVR